MFIERYRWTMADIDMMNWSDYCAIIEGAKLMFKRERKAYEAAAKGR